MQMLWAQFPLSSADFERNVFQSASFADLANAINILAWQLQLLVEQNAIRSRVVCYIGPSDVRYFDFACACCKCGLTALFSSPRNTTEGHLSLLDSRNCSSLLWPDDQPRSHGCSEILKSRDMQWATIPSLDRLFGVNKVLDYPWTSDFADVADRDFVVLHTSGSTGLPKAVDITHRWISCTDEQHNLPRLQGRALLCDHWTNRRIYVSLPPFHAAGLDFFLSSIFLNTKLVFGPADKPPSVFTVEHILDLRITDVGLVAPSILAEMATDKRRLAKLSTWSCVVFGGGPLPRAVGDAIWPYTKPLQVLGSTETHQLFELDTDGIEEWHYHNYHPALGLEFRPYCDNLYELVFVRAPGKLQGVFYTFPKLDEYSMNDLYEPHPSKRDLWRYAGRTDDIIVLSNGEKFNPVQTEQLIASHSFIDAAMIVGTARQQPALLVEPRASDIGLFFNERNSQVLPAEVARLLSQANAALPAYAQIHPTHVRVLRSRLQRSPKGEIQRLPSTRALESCIADLYKNNEAGDSSSYDLDFSDDGTLAFSLTATVNSHVVTDLVITADDDIFEHGFDSLHVVRLLGIVNRSLAQEGLEVQRPIGLQTIYQWVTITGIAKNVMRLLSHDNQGQHSLTIEEEAHAMFTRWRSRVTELQPFSGGEKSIAGQATVLLTGSAGSLGSYVLNVLVCHPRVRKVICLNRRGGDAAKQQRLSQLRGLAQDVSKVEFLETDTTRERFGLCHSDYTSISDRVTHIIHNAWPVNFNLALRTYEDQMSTCFRMIQFVQHAKHEVHTYFLSSVSVASKWHSWRGGPVPELPLDDFRIAQPIGYAQSKLAAERLFAFAASHTNMQVSICRIGQIAGPIRSTKGRWNPQEWFPSLLKTCVTLQKLPSTLGSADKIDWIPVDTLASILVESILDPDSTDRREETANDANAAHSVYWDRTNSRATACPLAHDINQRSPGSVKLDVLHFTNPRSSSWSSLVYPVSRALNGQPLVVPFDEWVNAISRAQSQEAESGGNIHCDMPAAKLIDFYRDIAENASMLPTFSTTVAESKSRSLQSLGSVSEEWLAHWIIQLGLADGR